MADSSAPEMKPQRHNGGALLVGILVAGLVAGVFIIQGPASDAPAPRLADAGSTQQPNLSPTPTPRPTEPADTPTATNPAPSIEYQTPAPLDENVKPPEDYDECVAYYESLGYNADNCQSPDPERESMLTEASARVEAAKTPLPAPTASPTSALEQNLRKCRVYLHSIGIDPEDCSKIPDMEYVDADKMFALREGCSRDSRDQPGVTTCTGAPEVDPDGDSGIDSVKSFTTGDWTIDGDFYGAGDDDARGLEWGGGALFVELTTDARATWITITDKDGEPLAPVDGAAPSKTIRATLPAGRYIVRTGTDAKTDRVRYRLTLKAG